MLIFRYFTWRLSVGQEGIFNSLTQHFAPEPSTAASELEGATPGTGNSSFQNGRRPEA